MNIILVLVCVLLNCSAQFLIRKGMMVAGEMSMLNIAQNIGSLITNVWFWLAMLCYGISVLLWMSILSKVEVSFAYPFLSIGYVVSAVIGYFFFGESLSAIRIAGIIVICFGVVLISRS